MGDGVTKKKPTKKTAKTKVATKASKHTKLVTVRGEEADVVDANEDEEKDVSEESSTFRCTFINLGEDHEGECDRDDPEALLRIDVQEKVKGKWEQVPDGSYCTSTKVSTPEPEQRRLLKLAVKFMEDAKKEGHSMKRAAEQLSWIEPSWEDARMGEDGISRYVKERNQAGAPKVEGDRKGKDYYVYFTLHVRLRLDGKKDAKAARETFEKMSDADAVNDGKILETEVTSVEEVE